MPLLPPISGINKHGIRLFDQTIMETVTRLDSDGTKGGIRPVYA
jgi:hypothetical protein